ncbi:MAG: hypothetical protein ACW99A_09190 [Candidatus Kariarchaeaceae archaeon]|jgi:hypothetical protein
MNPNITESDNEFVLYEINPVIPEREFTLSNTNRWMNVYIAFFASLFGFMFVALWFVLLYLSIFSVT